MAKKDFKIGADKFISAFDTQPQQAQETQETPKPQQTHYRINLKLRPQYKDYLETAAWKARKSITEYINDLIESDKQEKEREQ